MPSFFHAAYRTLLLLRFLLALAPGYLHPDEYFQSFEPAASLVLSVHTHPAWEWAPATAASRPIRSWLVLFMTTIKALIVEASTFFHFLIATPPPHRRTAA